MALDLPERTEAAEDAWIAEWMDSDDTDGLLDAITAVMEARRPLLAARLVGLLDDHVEVEPGSPVARAQAAARLILRTRPRPEDNSWSELEEAWSAARRGRMNRIRRRIRQRLSGSDARVGRLSGRRRR